MGGGERGGKVPTLFLMQQESKSLLPRKLIAFYWGGGETEPTETDYYVLHGDPLNVKALPFGPLFIPFTDRFESPLRTS